MGHSAESKATKQQPRLLVFILLLLMSHRVLFSFLCCIAGLIALLVLPSLAKNTYISENALMPGSANPMLSSQDVSDANKLVADIVGSNLKGDTVGLEIPRTVAKRIADLGAEASLFRFHPKSKKFHPLNFFSNLAHDMMQENRSCSRAAVSIVGIIRAPRGDGKESIVLVTPYNSVSPDAGEVLSLGVAYSVFSLLTRVTWLAKDIIWLAADSQHGEQESVAAWLREYYAPTYDITGMSVANLCPADNLHELKESQVSGVKPLESFRRAGTMAAALVIKVVNGNEDVQDSLSIYAEASNGQMPNLDLINVVNYLAVHRQGLHVNVGKLRSLLDSKCLMMVGQIIKYLGNLARSLHPQWGFGVPVGEYVEGAATLASSLYAQALGVPTGPHGAFRDYQIDAVTLVISPKASPYNNVMLNDFLLRSGRLIEGVIRSVNNLLEKFHQSFFLYLLTGPSKFVSVGVYMVVFALLVAPLPVVAASLYSDAVQCDSKSDTTDTSSRSKHSVEPIISHSSWRWLHAVKTVFVIHIWAVVVALLPCLISQIPSRTPTRSLLAWISLSIFSLHIFYTVLGSPFSHLAATHVRSHEWAILKSVMIAAAFIGLAIMSVVNFATAEIGALLSVPLCLMAHPLKLDIRTRGMKSLARITCNVVFSFVLFPPIAFFLVKGLFEGFNSINIGHFWNWVESLWLWNSATYLYLVLVQLPCWVLSIHILLHPC